MSRDIDYQAHRHLYRCWTLAINHHRSMRYRYFTTSEVSAPKTQKAYALNSRLPSELCIGTRMSTPFQVISQHISHRHMQHCTAQKTGSALLSALLIQLHHPS